MSLKQKTNDIVNEMDMDLSIAEEELTKDFDDEESEEMELDSLEEEEEEEEEEDKEIKRTRHGKPTPYAPKNGRAPHLHHLYANYGGEVMPYINMFDLQLSYETSDIELLYHLCERINKMIDIINAENKYINHLTDWTEKKIHKLFKHQKKFENYLLELLDEFEEEMNEKFSEFKEEINQEIKDFEDLVNEELESMNEEINRFENEMKERADAFEESMKERADAFESEMKERATAFETEVNERLDSMDKEIASFENEMKLRADNFENSINNEMSTFETEMRNRASEFEETMEKEQSNFESEMNTRADSFETSVNQSVNDFKSEVNTEINEFESLVNSTINDFSTDWTTKLNDFETYINHHMEEFESAMDERADSFESELKEEWDDFKVKFGEMYNEYITDITNQWNEFKNEMSEEWTSEKESLENEMNSYEETMNANYSDFKESIENYINECCENVQNEINSFEETVNKLIDDFENDYNERLETTTKEEVDAKIEDIVNQSIYDLIQQSEEFRNAISNVVNQLLEESETLKEMITDIVNNILAESEELEEKIKEFFDENFKDYLDEYLSEEDIYNNPLINHLSSIGNMRLMPYAKYLDETEINNRAINYWKDEQEEFNMTSNFFLFDCNEDIAWETTLNSFTSISNDTPHCLITEKDTKLPNDSDLYYAYIANNNLCMMQFYIDNDYNIIYKITHYIQNLSINTDYNLIGGYIDTPQNEIYMYYYYNNTIYCILLNKGDMSIINAYEFIYSLANNDILTTYNDYLFDCDYSKTCISCYYINSINNTIDYLFNFSYDTIKNYEINTQYANCGQNNYLYLNTTKIGSFTVNDDFIGMVQIVDGNYYLMLHQYDFYNSNYIFNPIYNLLNNSLCKYFDRVDYTINNNETIYPISNNFNGAVLSYLIEYANKYKFLKDIIIEGTLKDTIYLCNVDYTRVLLWTYNTNSNDNNTKMIIYNSSNISITPYSKFYLDTLYVINSIINMYGIQSVTSLNYLIISDSTVNLYDNTYIYAYDTCSLYIYYSKIFNLQISTYPPIIIDGQVKGFTDLLFISQNITDIEGAYSTIGSNKYYIELS